jgi:hypothetical protein
MRTSMIGNRICAFAVTTVFALLCLAAPATASPSPYDGSWSMVLVTTNGHCGVIKMGMAVNGGHISATSGKFVAHAIQLAGIIYGSGQTKINGVAGPRQAKGIGRFTKAKGSGKWDGTGPSGVCSGYWVADRA